MFLPKMYNEHSLKFSLFVASIVDLCCLNGSHHTILRFVKRIEMRNTFDFLFEITPKKILPRKKTVETFFSNSKNLLHICGFWMVSRMN